MTKLAPEWVRTSDPVIRSPARYRWTTAPAFKLAKGSAWENEVKFHYETCPWVGSIQRFSDHKSSTLLIHTLADVCWFHPPPPLRWVNYNMHYRICQCWDYVYGLMTGLFSGLCLGLILIHVYVYMFRACNHTDWLYTVYEHFLSNMYMYQSCPGRRWLFETSIIFSPG